MVLFLLVSFSPSPMELFIDYCGLLIQASVMSILYQGYKEFIVSLCCDGGESVMIIPTGSKKQIVLVMTQQLSFHQSTNNTIYIISFTNLLKFGNG